MATLKIATDECNHVEAKLDNDVLSGMFHGSAQRTAEVLSRLHEDVHAIRNDVEAIRKDMLLIQQSSLRARWKRFLSPRLNATPHHLPIPLHVPRRYAQLPPLPAPTTIALVTPAYKHGHFLERTLRSVLDQNYPRLQYVVQDGGSPDDTVNVLRRYHDRLTHWESRPDGGQANAINLGFRHAQGDIMAYLNSDDLLLPGALHYVAHWFSRHPNVDVVYSHRVLIDVKDREVGRWVLPPHDDRILGWADYVPQETLFWRRRIWEKTGAAMDESFQFALDWDLLLRFRAAGAQIVRLPRFLGAFRLHDAQKTSAQMATRGDAEIRRLRERTLGRPVAMTEVLYAIRSFLRRQVLYRHLYRFGLLRH
jgi:glycosyltransferase involved in cell wall biosynthesis